MSETDGVAALAPYSAYFTRPPQLVLEELEIYCRELVRWQGVQNLVSRETLPDIWHRHIADSLQVLKLLKPTDRRFLDLGSGGGLPALPLAIAKKGDTAARFVLVEPNGRKASFLRSVTRTLDLPVEVLSVRVAEIDSRETPPPDVITSRALASLTALCTMSAPFFLPQTRAIFHKGRGYREELVELRRLWRYEVVVVQSDTDASGVLLELSDLRADTAP